MTTAELIEALALPSNSLVGQTIAKSLLAEHASTAAQRRSVADRVEKVRWVAQLMPGNHGVPAYATTERAYLQLTVCHLRIREGAKAGKLPELVHRAIPHPVLLIVESTAGESLSVAHKRRSQVEAGKAVLIEGQAFEASLSDVNFKILEAFAKTLPAAAQPRRDLLAFYTGYQHAIQALDIARTTGEFQLETEVDKIAVRYKANQRLAAIDAEITRLQGLAKTEKRVAKLVGINEAYGLLRQERAQVKTSLQLSGAAHR